MDVSLFEQMGGECKLRAVIQDFIEQLRDDILIGYFFRKSTLRHLVTLEYQFVAAALGAPVRYRGRPMAAAHAAYTILPGHFDRRQKILQEILDVYKVPPNVRDAWLRHNESLRSAIVAKAADGGCV